MEWILIFLLVGGVVVYLFSHGHRRLYSHAGGHNQGSHEAAVERSGSPPASEQEQHKHGCC